MDTTIVSALAWVKRGFALQNPKETEFDEEDINEMKNDPLVKKNLKKDIAQINDNDDEDGQDSDDNLPIFAAETEQLKNQEDDEKYPFAIEEMSDEEKDNYQIRPTDQLIVAAKIEKEFSSLEVYVFDEKTSNLYVHHEIQLSAFPIAIEWLRINPSTIEDGVSKPGNFAIVGTFLPEIEIWDLDIINSIQPKIILGGEEQSNSKKVKKFKKQNKLKPDSHKDSVMTLNLNHSRKNILASGSADSTVKIWDLTTQSNVHTYTHHKDKVQSVKWNRQEEAILLTGSYDKTIQLFDVRTPNSVMKLKTKSDCESLLWDPLNPINILISTEDGYLSQIDARKFELDYIFHFKAHNKQTTSLSMSPLVTGMLATTSQDKSVKVWDTNQIINGQPKLVTQKIPNAGELFCGSFSEDAPWIFACGNSKGEIFVWDTAEDKKIVENFGPKVDQSLRPKIDECTVGENKAQTYQYEDDSESENEMDQEEEMDQE